MTSEPDGWLPSASSSSSSDGGDGEVATGSILVRSATPADVPQLVRLDAAIHAYHRQARPDLFAPFDSALVQAHLQRIIAGDVVLVAERDAALVGFLHAEPMTRPPGPAIAARSVVVVHELVVAETARQRGVGRLLMAAVEEAARGWGAADVRLQHYAFNEDAHRFYRVIGYEPELLTMTKRLEPEE